MAGNDRKRQKKLERKAARRKEKKKAIIRQESGGLPAQFALAVQYPILHCWMSNANFEQGIGNVLLSRLMPNGMVAFANFLVDRWCLGVKDMIVDVGHRVDYEEKIERRLRRKFPGRDVPPEEAYKYVLGAVEYARKIGFAPYPDYAKGILLFGDIDPARSTATFEYGKDGKPYYFAGPHEGLRRVREIVATLENHCGPGGFHYTIPLSPDGGVMAIDDEDDEDIEELPDERRGWDE